MSVVGFATLLSDLWLREQWLVPVSYVSAPVVRAALGAVFLGLALSWIYSAFLYPPKFSRRNYGRYAQALYTIVVRGLDDELSVIAVEVGRSAQALVRYAPQYSEGPSGQVLVVVGKYGRLEQVDRRKRFRCSLAARDTLLMLGNRRLCRYLVKSSVTPIAIFEEASRQRKYRLSLGPFARNISAAAIADKDSLLFHEDEGYDSGMTGYIKSFSKAVYGDYLLVEGLANLNGSPLGVDYLERGLWDADQLEAYSRAVLLTIESYLSGNHWGQHSYAIYRAIHQMEESTHDIHKLSSAGENYYVDDRAKRLSVALKFIRSVVEAIDKVKPLPSTSVPRKRYGGDLYDLVALCLDDILWRVAAVSLPEDYAWGFHHNTVWSEVFAFGPESPAMTLVKRKLRRLLFAEVKRLSEMINFKGARILGYLLYVMGLTARGKGSERDVFDHLHRAILLWTRKNLIRLYNEYPEVAKACLIGSVKFEACEGRLVKTYVSMLGKEGQREYLILDPMPDKLGGVP
jgi:hypothetical protein